MRPLLLLAVLLVAGCAADPFEPSAGLRNQVGASFVRVVDAQDTQRGVAVVVRATYDRVLLALRDHDPTKGARFLAFGEERVPTKTRKVAELTVLESSRAGRDLRAVHRAQRPLAGEYVFVYAFNEAGELEYGVTSVFRSSEAFAELLVTWGEGGDVERLLETAGSAIVMDPQGALVGFVAPRRGDARPRVIPFERVQSELLASGGDIPGAEHMWSGDGFLPHRFWVRSPASADEVPPVPDDWGDPDYFLIVEQDSRRVARTPIHVAPRRDSPPELLWLEARNTLRARLVERDVTLTGGDVDEDLAPPVFFGLKRGGMQCTFEALPRILNAYPGGVGPKKTRIDLQLDPVDPERASGADRTPLGARQHGLGRVARGEVDWVAGDATDFWSVDVEQGGSMLCFLFRERPDTTLRLQGFAPGVAEPVLSAPLLLDRRLTVAKGRVPPGRLLLRVRQVGGGGGPSAYSLFLFPAGEKPGALVRVLLRLVGRQTRSARAFMASTEFAREVRLAFADEAGLDPQELSLAFLDGLGDRIAEARALVLHMLHSHFRPTLSELEAIRRSGQASRRGSAERSRDAALLLARRCGDPAGFQAYVRTLAELEGLPPGVLERGSVTRDARVIRRLNETARALLRLAIVNAARDTTDPTTRMAALAAATRWREPKLRKRLEEELRRLLAQDPSPVVRRALERAFPPEKIQRRRLIRRQGEAGRRID